MGVNQQDSLAKTRAGRQEKIRELLSSQVVRSQHELRGLLAEHGFIVTQATLSRDLVDMRAYKKAGSDGRQAYVLPDPDGLLGQEDARSAQLERWCAELLLSSEVSGANVVLRTPPGAANLLASAVDKAVLTGVLGCIAGDDTILVITHNPQEAQVVAAFLLEVAGE